MDDRDRDEAGWLAAQTRAHLGQLAAHGTTRLPVAPQKAEPAPAPVTGALSAVREELGDCQRCKLAPTRKNLVFGVGNADADLVFVGEAPGANEDLQGIPFCGDAGQLLTRMIEAMGWGRGDVYICNILKCRPPGNRNPEKDEIDSCEPFLIKQLEALRPRMIVALGKFAAQWLTGKHDTPISALRGRFHSYRGIQVMPTYHPAYLLRSPAQKRVVWEDLQQVIAELGRLGIQPPHPPKGGKS